MAMKAFKNKLKTKKKKNGSRDVSREDEDYGATTTMTTNGANNGPLRFATTSKPKAKGDKKCSAERVEKQPTHDAASPIERAPPPAVPPQRKKAAEVVPEVKEQAASPAPSPVETPIPEAILDPERDMRVVTGRNPDNMTDEQLNNLRAFITQYDAVGVKGLLDEFESIKGYNLVPFTITSHDANPTKNRYKDIFCVEPSRVKLVDGREGGDYVHANIVQGDPFMNRFIATQGPIEKSVNDFWRLVVQENVGYIFMLCSIIELGRKKCEQYYPETEGETRTYLNFKVTLENKCEDAHFINSKLILDVPGKQKRYVYHHYWKNWPDHGVPMTALAGLRLIRHARLTNTPSIVHCSAGVGRTGTLIAIEWLLQKICTSPPPYDMKEMLKAIRNQRAHAIQTAPQYAYVAYAIFRMMAHKDERSKGYFFKFSADMQTHTGAKIDGGAAAAAALLAAPPPPELAPSPMIAPEAPPAPINAPDPVPAAPDAAPLAAMTAPAPAASP